ncbi:MAG: aspartate-semialdehyde dehydrogenase [Pseudomonadota bacterium]|nr:aspartate-semialdehyde dehydrogenase [Pseudomonadota bacterium]
MRAILAGMACLAIAACDSGGVPPPGQEPLRASAPQVEADAVELRADGLVAGTEAFYFAAGQREVETALTAVLGEPETTTQNKECGAGPLSFTAFPGGLSVHFQNGSLAGWNVSTPDQPIESDIKVVGDVQIGTQRSDAQEADGFAMLEGSTLGEEFSLGDRMGGFIEGDTVTMLYSGTQCFFR